MAKLYSPNMVVKRGDTVRSLIDSKVYVRFGWTPESLTLTVDPAVYYGEFTLDDNTFPIGTFKQFPYVHETNQPVIIEHGQWWLRSNNYLPLSSLPPVRPPIPDHIIVNGDYATSAVTLATAGLTGPMFDMVGDGNGNWMCVNTAGTIFVSINDGVSWTALATTTTANTRLATNGNGRWWFCNNTSNLYVSDNLGATWTLQTTNVTGATGPCKLLKYLAGKLFYASAVNKTISSTTLTSTTIMSWITDTNSTSPSWTDANINPSQWYPLVSNGSAFNPLDAKWDGNDTIWVGGDFPTGYFAPVVYKISTNTFVTPFVSYTTYNYGYQWLNFIGMYLNTDGSCTLHYHRPYYDVSNGEIYPTATVFPNGVTTTFYGNVVLGPASSNYQSYPRSNIVKVGFSILGCLGGGSNNAYSVTFRHGASTLRAPTVNGGFSFPPASSLSVMREAGGTIIIIGTIYTWRFPPAVGRVPRSVGMGLVVTETNFTDYIRVV